MPSHCRYLGDARLRRGSLGLGEIRPYTNEAMTENLSYRRRRGYAETHRAGQHGFRRVYLRNPVG
jgi:hypothetical protein